MNRRYRTAYSLVEMLIVIGIMSVVLLVLASTLHRLASVDRNLGKDLPKMQTMKRLSMQLRQDAHRAHRFSAGAVKADLGSASFDFADGTVVEYQAQPSAISRRVLYEGTERSRDLFRVPGLVSATWQLASESTLVVAEFRHRRSRIGEISLGLSKDTIYAALNLHPSIGAEK